MMGMKIVLLVLNLNESEDYSIIIDSEEKNENCDLYSKINIVDYSISDTSSLFEDENVSSDEEYYFKTPAKAIVSKKRRLTTFVPETAEPNCWYSRDEDMFNVNIEDDNEYNVEDEDVDNNQERAVQRTIMMKFLNFNNQNVNIKFED